MVLKSHIATTNTKKYATMVEGKPKKLAFELKVHSQIWLCSVTKKVKLKKKIIKSYIIFILLMVVVVVYCSRYIILLYCLYYFIVLKVKIKPLMLGNL